ncbi:hypothetical protein [Thalassobacillus pellis]|uniref:hypothetical protein n=1 Tax=Thalassobacillus pellis TaxID=748008 RepID=UPI0019611CB1|nr:hypothetical protein [Thalassobacillus pellis]MBM7554340.1 hypothetical protein [Thalassobacillus pellis]
MTMKSFLVVVALGTGLIFGDAVNSADQSVADSPDHVQASSQSPANSLELEGAMPVDDSPDNTEKSNSQELTYTSSSDTKEINTPSSSLQVSPTSPYYQSINPSFINPGSLVADPITLLYDKALTQLFKEGQLNPVTVVLFILIGYIIKNNRSQELNTQTQQTQETATSLKTYLYHIIWISTLICLLLTLYLAKQILTLFL